RNQQGGDQYTQAWDRENRLKSVTNATTGEVTRFYYDASGQRTMTIDPDGAVTYYPFPNYEETHVTNQNGTVCPADGPLPTSECEALIDVLQSLGYPNLESELNGVSSICDLPRIGCVNGHIQYLSLNDLGLNGTIPKEFEQLNTLMFLFLRDNQLSGQIPPELGNLDQLIFFDAGNNQLTGGIPDSLGTLSNLENLQLFGNPLSGEIPASLGNLSELDALLLNDTNLSGGIPSTLTNISNLNYFNYIRTGICTPPSGPTRAWLDTVPNWTGAGLECEEDLATLYCDGESQIPESECRGAINVLEGLSYPNLESELASSGSVCGLVGDVFCESGHVTRLHLSFSSLSGSIPAEIGSLEHLITLDLEANALSGPIPPEIGILTQLESIYLEANSLTGEIPSELGQLSNLRVLSLIGNNLTGEIPAELSNLTSVESIYLAANQLTGGIPPEFGQISTLKYLGLFDNPLSGAIPVELGNLTQLEVLELYETSLSGPVPVELTNLTNLVRFRYFDSGICTPQSGPVRTWLESLTTWIDAGVECDNPPTTCGGLFQEAENGEIFGAFESKTGVYSNGDPYGYVVATANNSDDTPAADNRVEYCFNVEAGSEYTLRAMTHSTNGNNDSFFVKIGDSVPANPSHPGHLWFVTHNNGGDRFKEDFVSDHNGADPVTVVIPAGQTTLDVTVFIREAGAELDSLELVRIGGSNETPVPPTPTFTPTPTPTFTPTSTPTGDVCGGLLQEGEDGERFGTKFVAGNSNQASGNQFVYVPNGSGGQSSADGSTDYVEFCMTAPVTGNYKLEAKIGFEGNNESLDDSFFVTVNDEPLTGYLWDIAGLSNTSFNWDEVSQRGGPNPVTFYLEVGNHTVRFHLREDGTKLDQVRLVPLDAEPTATSTSAPPTSTPAPPTATLNPPTPTNTPQPTPTTPSGGGSCQLLTNGGFENGLSSWVDHSGVTIVSEAHSGTQAMRVASGNPSQTVAGVAGETYTLNLQYKIVSNGQIWGGVDYFDSSGVEINVNGSGGRMTNSDGAFHLHSVTSTAPAGTTSIRVWIFSSGGIVIIDDVELIKSGCSDGASAPSPLVGLPNEKTSGPTLADADQELLLIGPEVGPEMAQSQAAALQVNVRKTYLLAGQPIAQDSYTRPNGVNRVNPSQKDNPELHYVYTDHLGSANSLVDQSGSRTETRFMPFGEIRSGGSELGELTERGFTGHRENREIGLTYMNARFYVPEIARFASADTIVPDPMNPQALNRFTYVNNNPLIRIDPSGHIGICLLGGVSHDEESVADASTPCDEWKNDPAFAGHTEWHNFSGQQLEMALEAILRNQAENPGEHIIIFGYSYGAAAALQLVENLMNENPEMMVENLVLLDPEPGASRAIDTVPSNVKSTLHYYTTRPRISHINEDASTIGRFAQGFVEGMHSVPVTRGTVADDYEAFWAGMARGREYAFVTSITDGLPPFDQTNVWDYNVSYPGVDHYGIYTPKTINFIKDYLIGANRPHYVGYTSAGR
ncbi:MAG: RHS repeat-associated core domain-containing protein, partial [Chloroflexota bacterium]